MLLAVLLGNVIYFAIIPSLPRYLQHSLYTLDPALLLDLLICIAVYFAVRRFSE